MQVMHLVWSVKRLNDILTIRQIFFVGFVSWTEQWRCEQVVSVPGWSDETAARVGSELSSVPLPPHPSPASDKTYAGRITPWAARQHSITHTEGVDSLAPLLVLRFTRCHVLKDGSVDSRWILLFCLFLRKSSGDREKFNVLFRSLSQGNVSTCLTCHKYWSYKK